MAIDEVLDFITLSRHQMFTDGDYSQAFEAAGLVCEHVASPMPGRDWHLAQHAWGLGPARPVQQLRRRVEECFD